MSNDIGFEREREVSINKSLQLKGRKSRFQANIEEKKEVKQRTQDFEQKAETFMQSRHDQQSRGFKIAKFFMDSLRDKTLSTNKGTTIKALEKEMREDLNALIQDLNNDPNQKYDGQGSLTAIALLVKTTFDMRDRMNELEFEIAKIKKQNESSNEVKGK